MKKTVFILLFILIAFIAYKAIWKTESVNLKTISRIDSQVNQVKKVIKNDSRFNKDIAFLVDMKIPSGKNRFFIYDLKNNKIIDKGIVAHGSGSETGVKGKLKFSNVPNSLSTSLGNYYIGNSYYWEIRKSL